MEINKIELSAEEIIELDKYLSNHMFNKDNNFDFKVVYSVYIKIQSKAKELTRGWIEEK